MDNNKNIYKSIYRKKEEISRHKLKKPVIVVLEYNDNKNIYKSIYRKTNEPRRHELKRSLIISICNDIDVDD
jgi:hypothetical protein